MSDDRPRNLLNVVDAPVSKLRRGPDENARPAADRALHCRDVHFLRVWVNPYVADADAQNVCRLVKGGVGCCRTYLVKGAAK